MRRGKEKEEEETKVQGCSSRNYSRCQAGELGGAEIVSLAYLGSRLLRVGPLLVIVLRSVWSSLGCCGRSSLL
ncbi:hypothetical protein RHMOL_Rhmol01G0278000 [Rhododendron molle]|uniref:Uncharacterized protein n=1 Tax=Rhododendron molle TaxID=49168 RepID=A0ACC0Q9N0_RHOML|nr:hypothetical protein RHMOL_Rhmol01G0278000 [Rhododendron molle]